MTVWHCPETHPPHPSALSAPWSRGGGMRVMPLDVSFRSNFFGGVGDFVEGGVSLKRKVVLYILGVILGIFVGVVPMYLSLIFHG